MQLLEVSGAVRPIYGSLGFKRLKDEQFSSTCRKQTHTGPDLINDASYLSPPHNNSATSNTDDWHMCLFNNAATISDQCQMGRQ